MNGDSKPRRRRWRRGVFVVGMVLVAALFLAPCVLVPRLGGASSRAPAEFRFQASAEAVALVDRALADLDPAQLFDYHTHVAGNGSGGSGCELSAEMGSWLHPWKHAQFLVYMDAARIRDLASADQQFVARLEELARANPRHGRHGLLAFDHHYRADGTPDRALSELYVPNEYVLELARESPDVFVPIASIHPYRADALAELERCAARGARVLKWLPAAMGIDPADARCDAFYERMAALGVALLSHAGMEQAVDAREAQEFGNPLRLRRALDRGVRVIVAHCASTGRSLDLDDPAGAEAESFDLFLRLMDDPRYVGRVFGEISTLTQRNRCERPLATMLARTDLHERLVNGSDYPLPAINVLFSTRLLRSLGYLDERERELLNEVYDYDPLLFDLVLKRSVKHPTLGTRFPASVFLARDPIGP